MPDSHWLVPVAVPRPLDQSFTYRVDDEATARRLRPGHWVVVPFGRTRTHAFVVEAPRPAVDAAEWIPAGMAASALKPIQEAGDDASALPDDVFQLCKWVSEYYLAPLGEVLAAAAPAASLGLRSARRQARPPAPPTAAEDGEGTRHRLTPSQAEALTRLQAWLRDRSPAALPTALLHGVTGSGKTELYIELAREELARGRGVILLVPEIALTPQLHARLERGLGARVALWHSALSAGKRRDLASDLRSGETRAVVGARSAIFAPVRDLGIILVDEEHDATYRQEDRVRYHARDIALVRARICGAKVLLGSATPCLESLERAREGKALLVRLPERATGGGFPAIEVVDLKVEKPVEGIQAPLAERTLAEIRETLARGEQVMVFLNRRGFSAFLLCGDCGEVVGCPSCSLSLTFHKRDARLRCHLCGHEERAPSACAKCQGDALNPMGAGTESLEIELPTLLPGARILRLDRDQVTSATRLGEILETFRKGEADLLLGTQMLVKGHDFPGVTLVVVILADGLFRFPDFRAPERALQVLSQVAGRAGRGDKPGRVLIQAFATDHPVLAVLRGEETVERFLEGEREQRELLSYPPFGRIGRIRLEDEDRQTARGRLEGLARGLAAGGLPEGVELLGPSEALVEKARGLYRWDLVLKAPTALPLLKALRIAKRLSAGQGWTPILEVDPQQL